MPRACPVHNGARPSDPKRPAAPGEPGGTTTFPCNLCGHRSRPVRSDHRLVVAGPITECRTAPAQLQSMPNRGEAAGAVLPSPAQAVRRCRPSRDTRSHPPVLTSGTQQFLVRRRRETTMNVATRATTNAAPMPPHAAAPAAATAPMRSGPPQQAIGASTIHPRPFSLLSPWGLVVLEGTGDLAPRPGGVPTEERGAGCRRLSSIWLILIITLDFLVADPRQKTENRAPELCGAGDVLLLERHCTTTGYLRRYRSSHRSSSWRLGSPWWARAAGRRHR